MELFQNILLISSCMMLAALAVRTGSKRNIAGMPALFATLIFFMVWVTGDLIELNSVTYQGMLWGRNIQQIGVFFTPLSIFFFSIDYTENRKARGIAYLISAVQVFSVIMIFTDPYHHLMRKSVEVQESAAFGHALVVHSTAIGSVLVAFNFCIPLAAIGILLLFLRKVSYTLRRPLRLIIISIFLTFVAAVIQSTILYQAKINIPIPVLNLPCVMLLFYAVMSSRFLKITPTVLSKVFEVMDQGIIVIDGNGTVIEYNKRAAEMIEDNTACKEKLTIGKNISELITGTIPENEKKDFSAENLPEILNQSQNQRYVSLTHHVLVQSKTKLVGYVLVLTDITPLKRSAEIDPLTGAYNREGLERAFDSLQKMYLEQISAMMIDLDNFKKVNDTYGHLCGDIILKDFVSAAQALLPENCILGRLGGDEFIIFLPVKAEDAYSHAENLRKCISERIVQHLNDKIQYTVSIGVTGPGQQNSMAEFMHRADTALYRSKECGRNHISCC